VNIDPMAAIPPAMRWRMEAEERQLERELEAQRAEARSAAEAAEQTWLHQQHIFEATRGYSMDEHREALAAMAAAAEGRDQGAAYGSESRPAVLVGDVELAPRPVAVQRSQADVPVPGQDPGDRAYMLRAVAALHERAEIARREAAAAEIRELEREVGEISR
jgi:hypothetical protein